ncbi:NLR family, CARD domain containing 5 [Scomber japonicus]|uniref:NLR family, CARD domain containing 5 n=1 Tax=Scomber japonicus TaxID=13676 RepID=UPI002304FC09|nr:NLR family, CARD domain containing 5 [Scomber japonicus]
MDVEFGPNEEDVNFVLAQESSELHQILSRQSPAVIMELCQMMPGGAGLTIDQLLLSSSAAAAAMLDYFKSASAAHCRRFLQSVCLLCENIPMHLESRLMSVAGYATSDDTQSPPTEPVSLKHSDGCEISSCSVTEEKLPSPPAEQLFIKRPRIDYWEQCIAAVISMLLGRWKRLTEHLVQDVQLENVWISLRTASRSREKPDQTPGSADRGGRTPEPDLDYGSLESRVTLETFLQGCAGKVTVLVGQAGSGKTLLTSCLGQQWARRLGFIPTSYLFVLLEFRQLNLLSRPLSLSDLLFHLYLPPNWGHEEKRAILDYLLSNPEQSCWVLDGYDEFHSKVAKQEVQREPLDPYTPLPVADLISGLLNRQLLPGCTVVVTCRSRDVIDLEGISDKVGQLVGWDQHQIKEYVGNFLVKGHSTSRALGVQAKDLLLSNRHLLAMSSLPALCNICCICLQYLLLEGKEEQTRATSGDRGGARGSEERKDVMEKEVKQVQIRGGTRGGREDVMMDGTNGRPNLPPTLPQIPCTLTQVYLTVLGAYLSHDREKGGRNVKPKTASFPHSTVPVLTTLGQYQYELSELSQLAWRGLEKGNILFLEEHIPQEVLKFSLRIGLLSKVELRREDGMDLNAYCFVHLTVQEFLAALRIMTSNDVSDAELKKRFSLKTRWMTRSDQRTVFTDSLYQYVCGLASSHCTQTLVQLARTSGGTGGQTWVQKRQALVLNLLTKLCQNNTLTGPKVLELCHCVQESQDHQLAKLVVDTRTNLELRNIRLIPKDIDALAFVANSVGDNGIGLDFGACSMDLECLDVLPSCRYIRHLSFHSRKYGDKFAKKLSSTLPQFKNLRKLEFCGASLTATGADSLASALQKCPDITEVNLSDNNLKDVGIKHIADIFTKLPRLVSVMLGRNNTSLAAVDFLIGQMSSCLNIQRIYADGMKEVTVSFCQNSEMTRHKSKSKLRISLLNQKWSKSEMQRVAKSLACCPTLSVLDLSGGQWDVETLKILTQFLPKFSVTKKIILDDSCSSVKGLVVLTALLSDCPAVTQLLIRLQSPVQVSMLFFEETQQPANEISKTLCLSCCELRPADLQNVWKSLGTSSDLTVLDLSSNCLGNKGLSNLVDALPRLSNIQEINASNNGIGMEGVVLLAGALCSHNNLTQIHISDGGRKQVILKFCSEKSDDKQQLKMFRIHNSSLLPTDMTQLCRRLIKCSSRLELDLSHSLLRDEAIVNLLKVLPKMVSLQRLNVSHSIKSTAGALKLINCLTGSGRVTAVELRPQSESFIHFDEVKAEQASCRFTHFSLNSENMELLLDILQHGPQLSDLDLSSNQLDDEAVKHLVESLPKLNITRYINLSNNRLTQQGLLDVASTLCTCDNVSAVEVGLGAEERCLIWFGQCGGCQKTLSIRGRSLERHHLVRLAEMMSNCPRLTKLEFKNNELKSEWIEHFVQVLNSSQRDCILSFEERWIRSVEAVRLVCRCLELNSNIRAIRVHHNTLHLSLMKSTQQTSVSADSADPAPSMATEKIGLVDCEVHDYHIAAMSSIIQRCPLLRELDFSNNSLSLNGAEFLCSVLPSLPKLTSLSIGSKVGVMDEKLSEALLQSTAIQSLNLSGHSIYDPAAQIITKVLHRLRSLNLSHCRWTATAGLLLVKTLGQCVSLEELRLESVHLVENSRLTLAQALRNTRCLRSLKLNKIATEMGPPETNAVLDLLSSMEELTRMEEIELEGWRMADTGAEWLIRLLPIWTELRKISLSDNHISDQSGEKLLEALRICCHLEELHLSKNSLGDLTAAKMALILPSLTHLTVLDVSENKIGCEGSVSLSKAIMGTKNLTKINLTAVGTPELCAVVANLAHCPLIQDVGLGWNGCGDEVVLELARVMPLCQKMTRIDLECNSVSAAGVEALVKALQSCPALQLIRLWKNTVPSNEAQQLSLKDRRLNFSPTLM